jgi:hypothetical protein
LVRWRTLPKPKEDGGWGLKNIYFFGQTLAAKSSQRMINHEDFGGKVTLVKCIDPKTIEDWIRKEVKSHSETSMICKALVRAFPLVGKWLA